MVANFEQDPAEQKLKSRIDELFKIRRQYLKAGKIVAMFCDGIAPNWIVAGRFVLACNL
jgi:hypothetical protein